MPLISLNMAIPMGNHRESQIYFLSNPQIHNVTPPPIQRKYLIFKLIQLLLCMVSLLVFVCGIQTAKTTTAQDMLICTTFGALLFYPLLFVLFSFPINQKPACLITINLLAALALFIISVHSIASWMSNEIVLENLEEIHPEKKFFIKQNGITMSLASSILTCLNGIFYAAEALFIYLEIKGYI